MLPTVRPFAAAIAGCLALLVACASPNPSPDSTADSMSADSPLEWLDWSPDVFRRATAENKLILLHLGAVWCHWCHVMEQTTYRDPAIVAAIREGFLPVHVDQDARPDLSRRYQDWGWPATIILRGDGTELAKLQGYLPPENLLPRLRAFRENPVPGPSATTAPPSRVPRNPGSATVGENGLSTAMRDYFLQRIREGYDRQHGGWGRVHKFLAWENLEWSLRQAQRGSALDAERTRETLANCVRLIDPVWGGMYQYSHGGTWDNPHFEKIMPFQAHAVRVFCLASAQWPDDPRWKRAAGDVVRYLRTFLRSAEGAFFTSQDADAIRGEHAGDYFSLDDAGRRAIGVPRIDTHIYASENGLAIRALVAWYGLTADGDALRDAVTAARWILTNRGIGTSGGFRHGEEFGDDPAIIGRYFLGDTLHMGQAFLDLYTATNAREWLDRAHAAADFIAARFCATSPDAPSGIATVDLKSAATDPLPPVRDFVENIEVFRFANRLRHFPGDSAAESLATFALKWLRTTDAAGNTFRTGGVLLAHDEANSVPLKLTVIGPREGAVTQEWWRMARACPLDFKMIERIENETDAGIVGPAALVCTATHCTSPLKTPAEFAAALKDALAE